MSTDFFDVIVAGAGVAGSAAAYKLSESGLKVLVLEKEKLPRYKTCGGGVVLRAANLLPFSFEPVIQSTITTAEVYDQENKIKFRIERKAPLIFMTMRADFDYFLINKAIEKGAAVKDHSEVKELINLEDKVEVLTEAEKFSAKFVIACDGATGRSMTRFKLNRNIDLLPAVESELLVNDETFNRLRAVARFDFGFVPHGYGWVFPKRNHLSVGVAFMKKVDQSINSWFNKYLELLEILPDKILKNEKHGYVIPFVQGRVKHSAGRILFAGDKLGFADPLTSEGISYAVETGKLAARAIIRNYPDHFKIVQNYQSELEVVYREIKSARLLSKIVYGPLSLRKFIFRHWGSRLSELLTDVITEKRKYSEIVGNPANYIKLLKPSYFFKQQNILE